MPSSHVHSNPQGSIYGLFFFVCQTVGEAWLVWCAVQVHVWAMAYQRGGRAERSQWLFPVSHVTPSMLGCGQLTHEAPVLEGEALLQRVERQVAAGTLGVVVGGRHARAGRLEAAAGDEGRCRGGAEGSTGEHLGESAGGAIGAATGVLWRCGGVERCRCWWSDAV